MNWSQGTALILFGVQAISKLDKILDINVLSCAGRRLFCDGGIAAAAVLVQQQEQTESMKTFNNRQSVFTVQPIVLDRRILGTNYTCFVGGDNKASVDQGGEEVNY